METLSSKHQFHFPNRCPLTAQMTMIAYRQQNGLMVKTKTCTKNDNRKGTRKLSTDTNFFLRLKRRNQRTKQVATSAFSQKLIISTTKYDSIVSYVDRNARYNYSHPNSQSHASSLGRNKEKRSKTLSRFIFESDSRCYYIIFRVLGLCYAFQSLGEAFRCAILASPPLTYQDIKEILALRRIKLRSLSHV